MTLKPTDMLEIQSAIDAYERKFPRRPEPSATAALKWRLGKREPVPWVRKALLVGWWGVFALVVASVFFIGALVGGFK
jgi:hypothetical protein